MRAGPLEIDNRWQGADSTVDYLGMEEFFCSSSDVLVLG
jgi:hypothetical protein